MTLTTTEELKHLASSDNTNELTRRLARECLANREAQPVGKAEITKIAAELVRGDYLSKLWTEAEKSRHVNTHRLQILLDELHDVMKVKAIAITQLLTAPPAPVVVKLPAEFYSGEGIVVRLEEVMAALAVVGVQFERKANVKTRCEFPAPAVPKEMTVEQAYENVQTWHYANGWNACRAAMLAQPVSSGYKLPDDTQRMDWLVAHHVTVRKPLRYGSEAMFTAQTITDEEDEYHATKLREQIDAAMLAAAPEGGNDA